MNSNNRHRQFDEQRLVQQAVEGDLEAFNRLVLAYQDMAYNYAYFLVGNPDSAEDVAQQSFIRAFQNIKAFRGVSFRSWLMKIVANSAYDLLRRSYRHPTQPLYPADDNGEEIESASWLADPAPSVQHQVEQNELFRQIYQILDDLPEVYRTVLTLIDIQELDYLEAAEALNVPIGTIKSRLARARLRMKQALKDRTSHEKDVAGGNLCLAV